LRANSLQSSKIKFWAEWPRMPKEWHSPFLGTNSSVEPCISVPMTMEILMTTASQDTRLCTVPTTPLTSVTSLQQHSYIELHGAEHHPAMQGHKHCHIRTQCYHHIKPWMNATTMTNHHYMITPILKNKNRKNTISFSLHHHWSRLPLIPEKHQLLLPVYNLPQHPWHTVTPPWHHWHQNLQKIQHSDPINTKTRSSTTHTLYSIHHQPQSNIMVNTVPAYLGHTNSSQNFPYLIGNNTQQSILPTENIPPTTDHFTICSSPLVPVTQPNSQSSQPTCPLSRITTASLLWHPIIMLTQNSTYLD